LGRGQLLVAQRLRDGDRRGLSAGQPRHGERHEERHARYWTSGHLGVALAERDL
jgi:hypothetical protein